MGCDLRGCADSAGVRGKVERRQKFGWRDVHPGVFASAANKELTVDGVCKGNNILDTQGAEAHNELP